MTFYVKNNNGFKPIDTMTKNYLIKHTREKDINKNIPCLYRKGYVQLLTLKKNDKYYFQLYQSVYTNTKWYLPNTWKNIWSDIYIKENDKYQLFYM